jgi:hypothetical protein
MATLTKGTQSITVPDDTVKDYVGQGWQDSSSPAPTTKTKKKPVARRKPAARTKKGVPDGVSARRDSDPAATPAGPEPVES